MPQRASIKTFKVRSPRAGELYITGEPGPGEAPQQASALFSGIAEILDKTGAKIFQERLFFAPSAGEAVAASRAAALGGFDDGVPPALLHVSRSINGPVAGAEVHAIICDSPLEKIEMDGELLGRIFRQGDYGFVGVSGLSVAGAGSREAQTGAMLEKAEKVMKLLGADMFSVARTWMWLADILHWYGDFNKVRNDFFRQRGLLDPSSGHRLPASTGIGVSPASGEACAMDMVGVLGPDEPVRERLLAGGDQDSAYEYGSAFSRAVKTSSPAGETIYVSGTAAIDHQGLTEHVGNAEAQIADTISHVRAVLADMGCKEADVVQAMAYCKDTATERTFHERWGELGWPLLVAVCDICRPELVFEVEATACPGAEQI